MLRFSRYSLSLIITYLFLTLVTACTTKQTSESISTSQQSSPTSNSESNFLHNLTENCVTNYDPNRDYFPEKLTLNYTQGFTISYHKNYKLITVKQPSENAKNSLQYLLVQCGTPIPKNYPDAEVVTIPVKTIVTMSTTYIPHLEQLDIIDHLVAVSDRKTIYNPEVRNRIKQQKITEVGESNPNIEKIIALNPDLIMTYTLGNSPSDSYPQLRASGLAVVLDAAHLEATPLARSEWLKFTASFFNREAKAQQVFSNIATEYQNLVKLANQATIKPTIFTGFNYKGTWYLPGGNSYGAKYLSDAGGDYLWKNTSSRLSLPLDFESVFAKAVNADIWLNANQAWHQWQDLANEDPRYADFKAAKEGKIFNNNARMNEYGGNDFWESGVANPHWVLADLIKIIHPELLPTHQLIYYQQIQPKNVQQ